MSFQHQKLIVYHKSLDLMTEIVRLLVSAKPGWPDLVDQVKRATTSIILNIAEGAAEFRPAEKARFYRMAARSAAEAHAALDVLARVGVLSVSNIEAAQSMLEEIAAMLVVMCKRVESRTLKSPPRSPSRPPSPSP